MDQAARLARLDEQRRGFGVQVLLFERDFGVNSYINRAPSLADPQQLVGAEILADRYEIIRRMPKNARVVEIGVDTGKFSRFIIENAAPADLTLIDIDLDRLKEANRAFLAERPEAKIIAGDSSTTVRGLEGEFDWIYIDADHGYDAVVKDTEAAWPKIKVGGYLIFNDFTAWSPANMMNYGVLRCAIEFLNAHPNWQVRYLGLQGAGYHDLAVQRVG
jgi:predicted O-methyltransferase YrrM